MILYVATIRLTPVTKKNSMRIVYNRVKGVPFLKQSVWYERYERDACRIMSAIGAPIDRPVNVQLRFYMPTRRRVDLSNLIAAANDVLVKRGILRDDNSSIVVSHDGSRVYYDKANPRTEIVITDAEEEET